MGKEYLYLNSRDELLRLDINNIVFFEGEGSYTHIVSANNLKSVLSINLSKLQLILNEKLKSNSTIFARIGKKYIINLNHIYSINIASQHLILSDGLTFVYKLNVSRDALKKLKKLYQQ